MKVLRERRRARGQAVCAIGALLLALLVLSEVGGEDPGAALGLGGFFLGAAVLMALMARTGVVVDRDGVTLRYVIHRKRIQWGDVERFSAERVPGRFDQTLAERPVVTLKSGETLLIPGANPMWVPSPQPFRVIARLEELRVERS